MKRHFAERLDTDIDRLLFDMRYAPSDDDSVRIRAINTYFRELRKPPAENERLVYEHAKKLFGDDIYFGTHATFHNELDNDEIWHTGCCWWDAGMKRRSSSAQARGSGMRTGSSWIG